MKLDEFSVFKSTAMVESLMASAVAQSPCNEQSSGVQALEYNWVISCPLIQRGSVWTKLAVGPLIVAVSLCPLIWSCMNHHFPQLEFPISLVKFSVNSETTGIGNWVEASMMPSCSIPSQALCSIAHPGKR